MRMHRFSPLENAIPGKHMSDGPLFPLSTQHPLLPTSPHQLVHRVCAQRPSKAKPICAGVCARTVALIVVPNFVLFYVARTAEFIGWWVQAGREERGFSWRYISISWELSNRQTGEKWVRRWVCECERLPACFFFLSLSQVGRGVVWVDGWKWGFMYRFCLLLKQKREASGVFPARRVLGGGGLGMKVVVPPVVLLSVR